jgi:hypothetical protein
MEILIEISCPKTKDTIAGDQQEDTMQKLKLCSFVWAILSWGLLTNSPLKAQSTKTQAQRLIDLTAQKHPEITGLELSATPLGKDDCMTVAATEPKDLGEKCDEDEATALRTLKPFVEHEPDGYDVTAPLHDANGKVIGTLGIDFKPKAGQTETEVLKGTAALLKEIEQQIPSKAFLFQPVSGV